MEARVTPGTMFGRLMVVGEAPARRDPCGRLIRLIRVKCACGAPEHLVRWGNLLRGSSKSCGCLAREITSQRMKAPRRVP